MSQRENECLSKNAMIKLFSSLRCLQRIDTDNDFFENISAMDTFLQEFRAITFVLQKSIGDNQEAHAEYIKLRDTYLINASTAWINTNRVTVAHKNPANLKKITQIWGITAKGKINVSQVDKNMDDDLEIEDMVKECEKLAKSYYPTIRFFHFKTEYRVGEEEFSIYKHIIPSIKAIIKTMHRFVMKFPCTCSKCKRLMADVRLLEQNLIIKLSLESRDYEYDGQKLINSERSQVYGIEDDGTFTLIQDLKQDITRTTFSDEPVLDIYSQFTIWTLIHLKIYCGTTDFMPVFIIIYNDNQYRIWPFTSSSKATYYRIAIEVAEIIHNENVHRVMYFGEMKLTDKPGGEKSEGLMCCFYLPEKKTVVYYVPKDKVGNIIKNKEDLSKYKLVFSEIPFTIISDALYTKYAKE